MAAAPKGWIMTRICLEGVECSAAGADRAGVLLVGHITSFNRLQQSDGPPPDMIAIDLDASCLEYLAPYEGDDLLDALFGLFERSINDEPDAHELIKARIRQSSYRLAATGGKIIPPKSGRPAYWLNIMMDRDYTYATQCCQSYADLTQGLLLRICSERSCE